MQYQYTEYLGYTGVCIVVSALPKVGMLMLMTARQKHISEDV